MEKECPRCKSLLEFEVQKTNIRDEPDPWIVVSKDYCPKCKYKIGLEKFPSSKAAHKYLEVEKEAETRTGTK